MPLEFDFSDKLRKIMDALRRKDPKKAEIIRRKAREIVSCDELSIARYKNLRHGLKGRKRVHIGKSFVLTFKYDQARNFILFLDFDHHDNIYKKK